MEPLPDLGRILIFLGLGIVALGLLLTLVGRVPFLGRLPGDFIFRKGNFSFFFPLATSILLSIILTLLFWLLRK
jgi:hypothetical protein